MRMLGLSHHLRNNQNQEREHCQISLYRSSLPLLCDNSLRPDFIFLHSGTHGWAANSFRA